MCLQLRKITGYNSTVSKNAKEQTFHLFAVQTRPASEVSQNVRTFQVTNLNLGSYSFSSQFPDFFQFSRTLSLAVAFDKFQNCPFLGHFFGLIQANRETWDFTKKPVVRDVWFLVCLIFPALTSAVSNLTNIALISMIFHGRQQNSVTFQALNS